MGPSNRERAAGAVLAIERQRRAFAAAVQEEIDKLDPDLRSSLGEFRASMQRSIPDDHAQRLIELGFLKQVLGGLKLTDKGEIAVHLHMV